MRNMELGWQVKDHVGLSNKSYNAYIISKTNEGCTATLGWTSRLITFINLGLGPCIREQWKP